MRTYLPFMLLFMLVLRAEPAPAVGKDSLVDITGVAVVVDEVSSSAAEDGFSGAAVKTLVEGKLARANVTVLEDREWFTVFGGSYLLVKIVASKSLSGDRYAVYVDTELYQTAVLSGKKFGQNITTAASTWSAGKLLSCESGALGQCVGAAVSELTDMFIKDYVEVNTAKWKQEQEWKEKKK